MPGPSWAELPTTLRGVKLPSYCESCCLPQVLMTFENLAAWGRCLCAVCPSPTTIITSGDSSVVCVWELSMAKGRPSGLHLKQVPYLRQEWGPGQV